MIHQSQFVLGQFIRRDFVVTVLHMLQKSLDRTEASGTKSALGAVSNGVILGVNCKFFGSLKCEAALTATILVDVTL
jgi:hypothetical protein